MYNLILLYCTTLQYLANSPLISLLDAPEVDWEVVLLEGVGVEGDGVGQVEGPRLNLGHQVAQAQDLVISGKKIRES